MASPRAPSTRRWSYCSLPVDQVLPPLHGFLHLSQLVAMSINCAASGAERVMIPLSAFVHTATYRFPVALSDHVGLHGAHATLPNTHPA